MKKTTIPNPGLELGFVFLAISRIAASNGCVDYSTGLWPYEAAVNQVQSPNIYRQYKDFIGAITDSIRPTNVDKIIFTGMESILCDGMYERYGEKYKIIMIPNSQCVDIDRVKKNYDNKVVITNPFSACDWVTANTIIVTPVFRLMDDTLYMYSYPRRFLGKDITGYSYRTIGVELLPVIQLDYRTALYSPELRELSQIDADFFNTILTFNN